MGIKSTLAMREAYRALKERGRIPEKSENPLERVARSRVSLAIAGAPLLYRSPLPEPKHHSAPTPENVAKAGGVDVIAPQWGTRDAPKYRLRHPLVIHGDKFPIEIELALTKFMADAQHHSSIRVANFDGSIHSGSQGRRLGGLGEAGQEHRDCHARHQWVWDRLNRDLQATASTLILQERQRQDGAFFSMEDFGAEMVPTVKCERTRKGVSLGMLRALGCELARLYRSPLCPQIRRSDRQKSEEQIEIFAAYKRLASNG